jgi:hypothetical protein
LKQSAVKQNETSIFFTKVGGVKSIFKDWFVASLKVFLFFSYLDLAAPAKKHLGTKF